MSTLTNAVHLGHTAVHAPVPGFEPVATCCATVPGGGTCKWHTEDHEHARVVFDDSTSTTFVEVTA